MKIDIVIDISPPIHGVLPPSPIPPKKMGEIRF